MATPVSSHAGSVLPEMESTLVTRTTDSSSMGQHDVDLGETAAEQVYCVECNQTLRDGMIDRCFWCIYATAEHQCVECGIAIDDPEYMDKMCADCYWDTEKERRSKRSQRCEECDCVTENEIILSHNYCYDCEFALWKESRLPYPLSQFGEERCCDGDWGGCECFKAPPNECLSCEKPAPNSKDMCEACEIKHQTNCFACVLKTPSPYISHICRKTKQ